MIIEINEEEREYLERICIRAEMFAKLNIPYKNFEKDLTKIRALLVKFKKLESHNNATKGSSYD